ncbi:hypothetical protein ABB55_07600 [Prosthecomicrobium hirschii]|uniref:Uncharacterized protein n=1 Tax=Prosthecodimorpha hirschii TaxID=665126 RepID=A0A0N8GEP6_9HYPH|nr:hypothetical protein [Prosthecomicrobium hirschii]KPL52105.1 hypothetical protein ABB55_07600 [Prosthecomicrobium hirschii]
MSEAGDNRPTHDQTAEAVERLTALLARTSARQRHRDWERVLGEMRKALTQLAETEIVQSDPGSMAILAAMVGARDMTELDFMADQLARRVASVIAARQRRAGTPDVAAPSLATPNRPGGELARAGLMPSLAAEESSKARTVLKL